MQAFFLSKSSNSDVKTDHFNCYESNVKYYYPWGTSSIKSEKLKKTKQNKTTHHKVFIKVTSGNLKPATEENQQYLLEKF